MHPQALLEQGLTKKVQAFCYNTLCLTVSNRIYHPQKTWLNYLEDSENRVAMSTPNHDPSGDYALTLFDQLHSTNPTLSQSLKHRAEFLVGNPNLPSVPTSYTAATWLIEQNRTDIFIGYAHYQSIIAAHPQCHYISIPIKSNISVTYGATALTSKGKKIIAYLLSQRGQSRLQNTGFTPL
jgi:molybdate transport system substrate-binding protein